MYLYIGFVPQIKLYLLRKIFDIPLNPKVSMQRSALFLFPDRDVSHVSTRAFPCDKADGKSRLESPGLTLVEAIIALAILSSVSLTLAKSLIWIQYTAENNLYQSTAFTVATGILEQIKSSSALNLREAESAGTFQLKASIENGTSAGDILTLGTENTLAVDIVTNGDNPKSIPLRLTPSIKPIGQGSYLLKIQYEYDHPKHNRSQTNVVMCIRSIQVNTF